MRTKPLLMMIAGASLISAGAAAAQGRGGGQGHGAGVGAKVGVGLGNGRALGTFAHWLGYPTFFVGPAVVAMTAGQQNPAVRKQAVEAVNFQLTAVARYIPMNVSMP